MTYKRYEKYKDSGVEWIGEIPEEWKCEDFRRYTTLQQGLQIAQEKRFYEAAGNRLEYITIKYINSSNQEREKEYIEDASERVICSESDILLARTGATGVVVTNIKGVFHNNFFKVNYNNRVIIKDYLVYYLKQQSIQEHFKLVAGTTTIPDLNHGEFLSTKCVVPSMKEQKQIANFLDKKTSEIDALISEKEKLIELLKEKRQAIITEAVTKGLNPNMKMKDSGVQWIGEIPEHWAITSVKHVISKGKEGMKIGPFGSDLKLEEMNESLPFKVYGQENLINDDFNLGRRFITEEKFKEMSAYELFPGDIAISMMGTIGKCKVIPKGIVRGIMDSHLIRIRTNKNIIVPEFLQILIDSSYYVYNQLINQSKGSIMNGLNSTIIRNIIIALPNRCEQIEILNYVKRKNEEINIIIENIENQTIKLKQYKQSLISEAVTGKIDVRELV